MKKTNQWYLVGIVGRKLKAYILKNRKTNEVRLTNSLNRAIKIVGEF